MPYDPKSITEYDRSYAYKGLWLGLPFSIALLVSLQFEAFHFFSILAGGFVSGTLIALAWAWSHDEFAGKEIAFAANWALSFAGVALFVQLIPYTRDFEPDAGMVLALVACVFHAALTWRRIADGALAGDAQ